MRREAGSHVESPSFRRAILLAVLWVFVDAFWLNQGVIAGTVAVLSVLVGLPRSFLPRFAAIRTARLRNLAIYLMAAVSVLVVNGVNNRIAQHRAEDLVSAVKAYHARYQRYPGSLDELVPEFVTHVPRAKYTLMFHDFWYANRDGRAMLSYTSLPPFGRPTYSFTRGEWYYLD
jgi:hypothetical protein